MSKKSFTNRLVPNSVGKRTVSQMLLGSRNSKRAKYQLKAATWIASSLKSTPLIDPVKRSRSSSKLRF